MNLYRNVWETSETFGIGQKMRPANEKAASMPKSRSTRTTQLYDRRSDEVTLDEVERVGI